MNAWRLQSFGAARSTSADCFDKLRSQPAQGYRVIYRRLPRLFPELTLAPGDGTYPIVLGRFARVDVLILEDRDGTRSPIITSQLPSDRGCGARRDITVFCV